MAVADPLFEYLQRTPSMMESFDESLSQLCKDNISESARDLRKDLMESYHDLYKALQSRYETLKIKEKQLEEPVTTGKSEETKTSNVTGSIPAFNKLLSPVPAFNELLSSVRVRSEIEILCDKADGRGLRSYLMDHRKEGSALKEELFVALLKAPDAAKLVLNALEPPFSWNINDPTFLLLKGLYRIFGKEDSCVFSSDVKDSAREIAKAWKDKMNLKDNTSRGGGLYVIAFLKFLATFKIAADYERNELWGLLLAVSRNAQNLVRCLGLSPNVSEFIDMLSNDGQQVDALRYANTFGMLDKIDPVDLLTSYLTDVEKAGKEVVTNAQGMAASQAPDYMARLQRDEDIKLRAAVRDVIELLRKYGLDSHVFEDKLRKLEQENDPEEQPEPGTKGKNNESKTSKVTVLNPGVSNLEQEEKDRLKNSKNAGRNRTKAAKKNAKQEEDGKKAAEKKLQEKEDGNKGAKKKAENIEEKEDGNKGAKKMAENIEEKDGKKASEKKAQEIEEREDGKKAAEKKAQETEEKEDGKKAAEKRAQEKEKKEGGKKDAEKKAQEKEDGNKVAAKKAQEKEDGKKDAGKKAQEKAGKKNVEKKSQDKEDGEKAAEKKAQEKEEQEDGKKDDAEKKAQHKRRQSFETGYKLSENENYASKRAKHASSNEITRVVKQKAEQEEDGKKASEKKAQEEEEEEDGKNAAEKKAQVKEGKEDGNRAAEKKAQVKEEREVGRKAAENKAQHKRRQSFQPGYGLSERENYASKRAKETTRVVGGMDNSKPSPYNIDGVQYNYGLIGHDHHPSASSAANTGLAAGAFASAPSIGAQINNERRRHEGNLLVFGTSNLAPIGSSLYRASVPAGPFAVPLSNVAAVSYDGRGQQSYAMNFVEVDKNHFRTSVYGTRDLSNSLAMQNNYNFGGRGKESYELNFGEIHNNPVRASSYVTGVSTNSSATQCHYERRVPELYTSTFGGDNTAGIGSSIYESNLCTIPSGVNHGSHERSLGQSSSFAGQNAVPVEPSGFGSALPTLPPSSVSQGHFERRGSVINKYTFNSG